MGAGGGWIGMILSVALFAGVLALLALAVVWFAQQSRRTMPTSETARDPDPLEIARRRLAAGEITVPEFEEIRNRLRS
jgi:uncharacterized membrane protein